ncbi:sigma-54-dependent Fis family transcriptional regulator [Bacillus sp. V5-8f]|uniref:sigma-54 interaction domain-containing protein n=1 Tax=Bacillus sp. V5-8f TaxID=2053044 RepID=UPI000C785217|nr:sigma 54-interacting transcriptional regulator [Bacillus sp. V5-8f]PLT35391.1 sigma-54-dependent Fis family transcriptional regulator [Bacillus sp. V5-8f]
MENVKSVQKQLEDWGYIVVKENGTIKEASADFCRHFDVKSSELTGTSIVQIIQGISPINLSKDYESKPVMSGLINGFSCLIRVSRQSSLLLFRVILRQDEVDRQDMMSFINTLSPLRVKKKSQNTSRYSFEEIIGESQVIHHIKELAARIATSNSTVLLTGDSGTGKELFAQAIHGLSSRKNHPFIAVNCAAIPDELFESELFGYESGAFSGAKREGKPGKIELAQNGTLFLDEISELPYQAQGKLLRVIQEREVERLGGTGSKVVDIRIIAATNRDLKILVQEGRFRQDLFYRLFVFELKIPSLRQRRDDILPLAYYFIDHFNDVFQKNVEQIDPGLKTWIYNQDWPGNVRELKSFIERGMNMVEGHSLSLESMYLNTTYVEADIQAIKQESTFSSLEEEVCKA